VPKKKHGFPLHILDTFLLFIPVSIIIFYLKGNTTVTFITAALSIIGVTHLLAESTGIVAQRVSTAISALINATFGNVLEFMIAIFALQKGLVQLVRASIVGSIIINVLLLIGLSMVAGGLKYKEQKFNKDSAGLSSTMLIIAVVGLAMPTLYNMVVGAPEKSMSFTVSIILGIIYLLSLVYTFGTHRHLFTVARNVPDEKTGRWTPRLAIIILIISTIVAGFESNILVESVTPLVSKTRLTETFLGLVFVALLTNIPEHVSAMTFARRNNMTLSLEIGMSSALQIALFVVPVLVLVSSTMAGGTIDLVFGPFEITAVLITAMLANYIGSDGICHWVEGAQLIAVYLLIAVAFYFL
jgi:Ca2+:H+ antiporter